jgi:hypothetical protein
MPEPTTIKIKGIVMKSMDPHQTIGTGKPRAGEEYRTNGERLFHVDKVGWYVHTREGLSGPFDNKDSAETHVAELTHINRTGSAFMDTVQL